MTFESAVRAVNRSCVDVKSVALIRHGKGKRMRHIEFWALALLWLPAGIVAQAVARFGPSAIVAADTLSLAFLAACGLPLAFGCRRLWRVDYRRTAWVAGVASGIASVAASVPVGLFGPVAVALCAAVFSLPVWIACQWLAHDA